MNFNAGNMTITHSAETLTVAGGTWATAALTATTITGSGVLSIDDTTESTSTITGSIQTDGGIGIAKTLWVGTTQYFAGTTTHGANIVSDADGTDDLGTSAVRWANLFVDDITITTTATAGTSLVAGTATIAAGSITDSSGAISFGNENLTTSGALSIDSTTNSTSKTTGSIQTDGGLGVCCDVCVGCNV